MHFYSVCLKIHVLIRISSVESRCDPLAFLASLWLISLFSASVEPILNVSLFGFSHQRRQQTALDGKLISVPSERFMHRIYNDEQKWNKLKTNKLNKKNNNNNINKHNWLLAQQFDRIRLDASMAFVCCQCFGRYWCTHICRYLLYPKIE